MFPAAAERGVAKAECFAAAECGYMFGIARNITQKVHFFFIQNVFYKNIEAEITEKQRTLLRTSQPQIFEEKILT